MPAWLDRLLRRAEAPPPTPRERAGLEHERRRLERDIRQWRKVMGHGGDCRTCTSPHPGRLRMAKRLRAAQIRMAEIERRLAG